MFRRIFWLSFFAGVGYMVWRWLRQQQAAPGLATPLPADTGARPTAIDAPGTDAPAGGPRRIPTRLHHSSPPAAPLHDEPPATPELPAAAGDLAELLGPQAVAAGDLAELLGPQAVAAGDLAELLGPQAVAAGDLAELLGAAVTGDEAVDLASLVGPQAAAPARGGPLTNINTADEAALIALPGIGPALARRIIAYRSEHGPFGSVDQLVDIQGIGPRNIDDFRHLVTV